MFDRKTEGKNPSRKIARIICWSLAAAMLLALFGFGTQSAEASLALRTGAAHLQAQARHSAESKAKEAQKEESFFETELTLTIDQKVMGDELLDLIEDSLGMDIGWLESLGLYVSGGVEGQLLGGEMIAVLNGKDITGLTGLFDRENGEIYLNIPALCEKGFKTTMEELTGEPMPQLDLETYLAAIPDQELLGKLFERYFGIIGESFGKDVEIEEKDSETVIAGGLEGKYQVTEMKLGGKALLVMAEKLLTELRDDADVKELFASTSGVAGQDESEMEEGYREFVEGIDKALAELKDVKPEDVTVELKLTVYMNEEGKLRGLGFEVNDGEDILTKLNAVLVVKGKLYGLKLDLLVDQAAGDSYITLDGGGELDVLKKTLNGKFELLVRAGEGAEKDEMKLLELELDAALTDDGLRYQLDMTPAEALLELALEDEELPAPVEKFVRSLSLRLRGEVGEEKFELLTAVCTDKKECLTLSLKGGAIQPYALEKPADALSMEEWQQSLDFNRLSELITKLREAGVPAALLESMGVAA